MDINSHIQQQQELRKSKIQNSFTNKEEILEKGGEGSRGGKIIGHTKSGKPIYESHNSKEHGLVSHSDYESQVPGYLNMKEKKEYDEAKNHHDNWGQVTHHNKAGYDAAQSNLSKKATAYREALHKKLKEISSSKKKTRE